MPIAQLVIALVIVGLLLYVVNQHLPLAPGFKQLINAVVVIGLCVWLLNLFGLFERNPTGLVDIVVILVVLGLVVYLLNVYVPMAQPIKIVVNAIIILAVCVWLLDAFGVMRTFRGGGRRRGEISRTVITSVA